MDADSWTHGHQQLLALLGLVCPVILGSTHVCQSSSSLVAKQHARTAIAPPPLSTASLLTNA
jgi:hypothetical protein